MYGICLGGANLSIFDECVIVEELARGCAGICVAINSTNLGVSKRHKIFIGME